MELHRPIPSDQFEAKLLECFGGEIVEDTAESSVSTPPPTDKWTTERRLAPAAKLPGRKDSKGRLDVTKSEIDSHLIGLRCCADEPGVAEMVANLKDAPKTALDWSHLAKRIVADRRDNC
ncbi:MAG TPA: hypothetical protein VFD27_00875 [Chthoniobacteraceae bacterium]|nr:hypothetical protein [Chthoniobacteraceae bacterium]